MRYSVDCFAITGGDLSRIINVEMIDYQYYQGAAIALVVVNAISFLALLFVITIYLIRWKQIAAFPMRLVHAP